MICFPLDNTNYLAESLGAWFGTRTRGVFSANNNYNVTSNNNLTVTVSAGLGWLKADTYWGVVVYEKEAQILDIDLSDGSLERYDMVCVQLDKNMNQAKIVIKKGAYSQNAVYPPMVRNSSYDEIYLAAIKVRAGATKIDDVDITDLRLNETYCGIMRDGVTGIPTDQLFAQWQSWYEENTAGAQNSFTEWFDHIKDQLSTDAAGNLQNQIDGIKPYIINYVLSADVTEQSRLGLKLSLTENIKVKDGMQIILSVTEDVSVTTLLSFSGTATLSTPNEEYNIFSVDGDTYFSDIKKGGYLYLIYSSDRKAFISQSQITVNDSLNLGGEYYTSYANKTQQNLFPLLQSFGKGVSFENSISVGDPARIYKYADKLMLITPGTTTNGAVYLGVREGYWSFSPLSNGGLQLGHPTYPWANIYANNGVIQKSDKNSKKDIEDLDDDFVLNFVDGLQPKSYKMKDGTSGRTHFGFISQDVESLLGELGKKSEDFAGFIKSPKTEQYTEKDEQGNEIEKYREIKGEYLYGLRYEEFIALIFRYTQIKAKEFDARLTALEKGKG